MAQESLLPREGVGRRSSSSVGWEMPEEEPTKSLGYVLVINDVVCNGRWLFSQSQLNPRLDVLVKRQNRI